MSSPIMDTKICALCGRGEKSLMGQGDLIRFEPTPGFNPFRKATNRINNRRSTDTEDPQSKKASNTLTSTATCRRSRVSSKGKDSSRNSSQLSMESEETTDQPRSQSQTDGEGWPLPILDELSLVGYPEDMDANDVFEKSGHVIAHHCCAAWSDGVIQKEDLGLCNVDKAVFAGFSQKCGYCLKYGATIKCKVQNCSNKYHYPCASGGGCFQDIKTLSLLCPEHAGQAINIANQEACCVVCDEPGCISDQLFCTSCGQHYHGNCLDPTVEVNPVVRAGWQCPECKICQTCRQPGDDNKMLVCDTCDKGYHTFCLRPVMSTIPKNGWKCKNCRVCGDCGSRTPGSGPSSRWHLNYSVCDSCYQQRNKGLCCPLCGKAYRHFAAQNKMLLCNSCKRHVHAECDESYDAEKKSGANDYTCVMCRNRSSPILGAPSSSESTTGLTEENKLQDIENFGIFKVLKEGKTGEGSLKEIKSEELCKASNVVLQESSVSSSDSDLKLLDKNLSNFVGMDDQSLSKQMIKSSDSKIASTPLSSSSSTRGSALTPALNQGKPQYNQDQYGKKMGARNKSRSVGVGKKKRPTHASDRKRGPKPKIKQSGSNQQVPREDQNNKDEEHTSTLVICSTKDQFTLKQDMCLSCGSFGKGEEGKLIACVQCGQCYHPYCVSIKVSPSLLEKGWRCLDCTVCEGCGKPHDEGRLILCDECDISFHTYCLDPPLEEVPQGTWKCKWCIVCLACGERSPGTNCQWQDNYSKCGPCASLEKCPVCVVAYNDLDLIIQCCHCERWIHGNCDGIKNEDDAESAMEAVYHCPICRPITGQPGPVIPVASPEKFESPRKPPSPVILLPTRDIDLPRIAPKTFYIDGICLSEVGLAFIRKQSQRLGEKKRNPSRWKRTPGLVNLQFAGMSSERSEEDVDGLDQKNNNNADLADCNMDGGPEDDMMSPSFGDRMGDGSAGFEEKKKRPRMRMGMGVGGFIPRSRTRGGGINRSRMIGGMMPVRLPSGSMDMMGGDPEDNMDGKKMKQRRPRKLPKRSHLEDAYPAYLQDAFFGRDLLDQYKPHMKPEEIDLTSEEPLPSFARSSSTFDIDPQQLRGRMEPQHSMKQNQPRQQPSGWVGDLQSHPQQMGEPPHQRPVAMDPLDVDSLDKDQAIDSLDQLEVDDIIDKFANSEQDVLAQIDNETLEDILKNGLNGDPQQDSEENFGMHRGSSFTPSKASSTSVSPLSPSAELPGALFSHGETSGMWSQQQLRGNPNIPPPHLLHQQQQQFAQEHHAPGMFMHHQNAQQNMDRHLHMQLAQQQQQQQQQSQDVEEEEEVAMEMTSSDNMTCNQRNIKKWQSDEMLGDSATISQVLYANMCHPELRQQHPDWNERVKQIAKLWRKVPTEKRGPYLAKARANRAAYRSQNSHKDKKKATKNESAIHQQIEQSSQELQNASPVMARDTPDPYAVPPGTPHPSRPPSVGGFLHPSTSQGMNLQPTTSASAALFKQPHPKTPMMQQHFDSRPPSRDYHALHQQHQANPMEHFQGNNAHPNETSPGLFAKHPFTSTPSMHLERSASVDVMKHQQQYQSPRHSQEGSYQGGDHGLNQMGHSASPGASMMSPQQSPKVGRSMASGTGYQRSISDPYGGIRPPSDPYSQPPSTPRPEPYVQMYPPHVRADPYAQPPSTPRPSDHFNQPVTPHHMGDAHPSRSNVDSFGHHPRASIDPYAQMPMTPRPVMPADPYMQQPMTPRPSMGGEFNQQMMANVRPGVSPLHHMNHPRMMQQQGMMLQQGHSAPPMQGADQFQNQSRLLRPSGPINPVDPTFMQQRMPGYEHVLPSRYPGGMMNAHHMMNKEAYHHMAGGQKPGIPPDMYPRGSAIMGMRGSTIDFGLRQRHGFEGNYPVQQKFAGPEMYAAQQQQQQQQARLPHDVNMRYPVSKQQMETQQEQEQAFIQQQHFQQQMHQLQQQKAQTPCANMSMDVANQSQGEMSRPGTAERHSSQESIDAEPQTSSTQDSEETDFAPTAPESETKPGSSKQQLVDLLAKQSNQKKGQEDVASLQAETSTSSTETAPASTSLTTSTTSVTQTVHTPSGSSTPLKHWPVDAGYEANLQHQGLRMSTNVGLQPSQQQQQQQQLLHMQQQHQQNINMLQQDFNMRWPDPQQQQAMLRLSHAPGMSPNPMLNQHMDQSTFQQQQQSQQQNCLMNESQLRARFLVRPMRFSPSFPASSTMQFGDDPNSYQQYPGNPAMDPRLQQIPDQQQSLQLQQQQQQAGMRMLLRQSFMPQHQQLHPRMFQQIAGSDGSWKLGFAFQQQPQHLQQQGQQQQQQQQHLHQVQQQMQQQFLKAPGNMIPTSMSSPTGHQPMDQSMPGSNFGMHHQITSLQHLLNQNQSIPSQSAPSSAPSVQSSMLLGGDSPSKMVEGNTDDQIEDLLGSADDGFNLLEYADDDLECNDKTIFDEHLGLIPPQSATGTSSNQSVSTSANETNESASGFAHQTNSDRSNDFNKQKIGTPPGVVPSPASTAQVNESAKDSPSMHNNVGEQSVRSQEETSQHSQSCSSKSATEEMEGMEEANLQSNEAGREEAGKVAKKSPKEENVDSQLDGADDRSNLDDGFVSGRHEVDFEANSFRTDEDMEVEDFYNQSKLHFKELISLSPICQLDGTADDEEQPTDQKPTGKVSTTSGSSETAAENVASSSSELLTSAQSDVKNSSANNKKEDGAHSVSSSNGNVVTTQEITAMSSNLNTTTQAISTSETQPFVPVQTTQTMHAQPQTVLQLQQHVQALQQRRMLLQQQQQQQQVLDPRLVQQQQQQLMMMARAQIGLQQKNMDQLGSRQESSKSQEELLQLRLQQQQQLLQMQQTRQLDASLQRFSSAPPPYQTQRTGWTRLQSSQIVPSSLYPLQRQQKWDMFQLGAQQQQLLQQQLQQQQQIFMQQHLQQQLSANAMQLSQKIQQEMNTPASSSVDVSQPPSDVAQASSSSVDVDKTPLQDNQTDLTQKSCETSQTIQPSTPSVASATGEYLIPTSNLMTSNVDLSVLSSVNTSVMNAFFSQQLQGRPQGLVGMRPGIQDIRHQPSGKDARLNLSNNLSGQPNISLPGRPYLAPGSLVAPRMMSVSSGLSMSRITRPLAQFNPMNASAYQQQFNQGGRVSLKNMPGQLPPQSILSPKYFESTDGQIGPRPPSKPPGEQPLLLEDLLEEAKQEQRRKQAEQQQTSSSMTAEGGQTSSTPATTQIPLLSDVEFEKLKAENPTLQGLDAQVALNRSQLLAQQRQLLQQQQQQQQGIHVHQDPDLNWQNGVNVDNANPSAVSGFSGRPPNMALPMRMASPFVMSPQTFFDPSVVQMPGQAPAGMQEIVVPLPPQRPPDPPNECTSDEDKLVQKKYEEWLIQNEHWLTVQVQSFSDQVAKFRKTKKALTAKQRVARKNGNELNEGDAQNLEETSKEQSRLQKQLDQLRKQHRTHKTTVQEYKAKHQPVTAMLPPPTQDDQQSCPSTSDQMFPDQKSSRPPISSSTARLPAAARQEYEQYVQERLKHQSQTLTAVRTTLLQGDENNPFSETYQQREKVQKLRLQAEQRNQMDTVAGPAQNIDNVPFAGATGEHPFPPGIVPPPQLQSPGMGQPFVNYQQQPGVNPIQQAPVNQMQFVGPTGARFGMRCPSFPNVDGSGIAQQHCNIPADAFQSVGLKLLTSGSSDVPVFHPAQQSLDLDPSDDKPKKRRRRRKSIFEKDEITDVEKSRLISPGMLNRPPIPSDNNLDQQQQQQMMMMMMIKNSFPASMMQPADMTNNNTPADQQQRILQQIQQPSHVGQFQNAASFGSNPSAIDETSKMSVQDAILRKLLDSNKLVNSASAQASSKMSEDEEETVSLTPEQQRTLAIIESMPLTIETNKDDATKKQTSDKDAESSGMTVSDAQLHQLIKANSKARHRRSPKQEVAMAMQVMAEVGGPKKRQKKAVAQQMIIPPQLTQQQLLQQQIIQQQQLFQQQQQQVQHNQHLLRQVDRPNLPPHPVEQQKVVGRIDHTNLLDQLIRQLQLQPTVLLKEPDVSINSNQFLDPNLKPGVMDAQLVGMFGSVHSMYLPMLEYYSVHQFVNQLWLPKPMTAAIESQDGHTNQPASNRSSVESSFSEVPSITVPACLSVTTTTCSTPGKLQLVTSILNKNIQQPPSCKLPTSSIVVVEPQNDSSDSTIMSVISSSSPEPSLDDPPSSTHISVRDLLLLPDVKLPMKEILPFEPMQSHEQAPQLPMDVEVKTEITHEEVTMETEVEVKPSILPEIQDDRLESSPKSADHVSVMLTLSVSSAENISGVIAAIANLLKIAVPSTYEITRSPSPNADSSKTPWISNARHRETAVNIQALMRTKTSFCKNCDAVIIGPGVRKPKSDLFFQYFDEGDKDDLIFCGTACCLHFSSTCRHFAIGSALKTNQSNAPSPASLSLPIHPPSSAYQAEMRHSLSGVYDAKLSVIYSSSNTSIIPSVSTSAFSIIQPKSEVEEYPMEMSVVPHCSASSLGLGTFAPLLSSSSPLVVDHASKFNPVRKIEKNLKHKATGDASGSLFKNKRIKHEKRIQRWKNYLVKSDKVQRLSNEKEIAEIMERQGSIIRAKPKLPDGRCCMLCKSVGDAETNGPGRLLLLNADRWVHLNCALWSYEVYETMNGALMNVDHACKRGMPKKCVLCNTLGATITCFQPKCSNQYHLDCATKDKAIFFQDKTIICHQHASRVDAMHVLSSLCVFRRVYVNRDEDKQVAKTMQHEERRCVLRVGSLIVHNIGQLLLHQIQSGAFNNHDYIFPVGYRSSRFYWSYRQMNKRCRYICKIEDKEGTPEFSVSVLEKGFEQLVFKSDTCKGAWVNVLEPLEKMRKDNDLVKMFPSYLSGEDLFGLAEPSILKLIESLPGIELLSGYNFKYGRTPLYKLPLAVNPSGSARTEPKLRTHFKSFASLTPCSSRPQALHNSSGTTRSHPTSVSLVRSCDNNSPYLKQFVHSKTQQYRRLKNEWRSNVYLRRSNIQGLGLFAARELEKHTMVIEYIGELIRTEVSENREKVYNKINRGVYMFRIHETNYVVDATMCGGPARYVNHSCNPNCVAELVPFDKEKDHKIIIITKRKIAQGEELCYDYKFDVEDDQSKIPCLCGAPNCRKWMN